MLVRHNTALLEQAIDLQVKRQAIPMLQAEAAAHDRIARANGFRRLATGTAVAVAAVGIGLGVMMIHRSLVPAPEDSAPKATERITQDKSSWQKSTNPKPAPTKVPETKREHPVSPAEPPSAPNAKTFDFTKFVNQEVSFGGTTWTLTTGHHFTDENDQTWDKAWCYTRSVVNGVDVNLDLVNRESPKATPLGPISSPETIASLGLSEDQAKQLASKCAWLDNANYGPGDFADVPNRAKAPSFVVEDGWDALGHDLPSMPIQDVTFEQCQMLCERDNRCAALTYNKAHSACFKKGGATVLVREEQAIASARQTIAGSLVRSSLVFAKNTVIAGKQYASGAASYADCVMACASDQRCQGFNHDHNKVCALLDSVTSSSDARGVVSGVKAASQ